MRNKGNLKRLKRSELLELLLEQSKEVEFLKEELKKSRAELENRNIILNESGSIAEASLKLTNIFNEAQKAADLFIESTKKAELDKQNAINKFIEEEYKRYGLKKDDSD